MKQTICHSKILEKLQEKSKQTGNHCGMYITQFNGNLKDLRKIMNDLYIDNKITVHDGIHGKLIKIKKSN